MYYEQKGLSVTTSKADVFPGLKDHNKQVASLHFTIGDITTEFAVPHDYGEFSLPAPYRHFVTDLAKDVTVTVRTDFSPLNGSIREKLFDTGPNWSLFRLENQYIIQTMFVDAFCEPDYSNIDIYPRREPEEVIPHPAFLAYPLPEIVMINLFARHGGVLLHSCGIVHQGEGILFCGMSGAGKSTLANIWQQEKDTIVLSDDRIIVRKINAQYMMYGTPWHGEAGHCSSLNAPLSRIFFIEHASENQLRDISRPEAVSHLVTRSFPPLWNNEGMSQTLEFLDNMTLKIPCTTLGFVPDGHVIECVKNSLKSPINV